MPGIYLGLAVDPVGAAGAGTVETLTRLTELVAAHGVYALLVIFLFYLWRRSLKDYLNAAPDAQPQLLTDHQGVVRNTYRLLAVAVPVWIFSTFGWPFLYHPKTVLWGSVSHLRQQTLVQPRSGEAYVREQIAPEQPGVRFYTHPVADTSSDPPVITVEWALVQDGQNGQVPFIFSHSYQAWETPDVALDPNSPSLQPRLVQGSENWRFVVNLSALAAASGASFDYRYYPDTKDPVKTIGRIRLFRNGKAEDVQMERLAVAAPSHSFRTPSLLAGWFHPPSVYAEDRHTPHAKTDPADAYIALLSSSDLALQVQARSSLQKMLAHGHGWDAVRRAMGSPASGRTSPSLPRNLTIVLATLPKDLHIPADVRLMAARESYTAGDYKSAASLYNGLKDDQIPTVIDLYYRGVTNLEVGDYRKASRDFARYIEQTPESNARTVARQALAVVQAKLAAGK
jgi:hypothetical protein